MGENEALPLPCKVKAEFNLCEITLARFSPGGKNHPPIPIRAHYALIIPPGSVLGDTAH